MRIYEKSTNIKLSKYFCNWRIQAKNIFYSQRTNNNHENEQKIYSNYNKMKEFNKSSNKDNLSNKRNNNNNTSYLSNLDKEYNQNKSINYET